MPNKTPAVTRWLTMLLCCKRSRVHRFFADVAARSSLALPAAATENRVPMLVYVQALYSWKQCSTSAICFVESNGGSVTCRAST